MLDPAAQQSSTGGYPWLIDKGSSTFVYIKNVSDNAQQYHLQLSCEVEGQQGEIGVYSPGLVTIESGQTISLDIKRLRDEQVADEAGRVIPVEANRGQVMWSVRGGDNLSLIGRAEQADEDEAVSSTYACQNCCPDSFNDGWCDPFSVEGVVGSTEQFTANQQDRNCYGTILTSYVVFASWSSSNTSIATVDGNGLATAQGPGSTDIFASWYVSTFLSMEGFPQCIEEEEFFSVSSVCTVFEPIITVGNHVFTPAAVTPGGNPDSSVGSVTITASNPSIGGLQTGDFVVVEIIKETMGGSFEYVPMNQEKNVTLNLGGPVQATFEVKANVGTPANLYTFRIRVREIKRPPAQQGGEPTDVTGIRLEPANGGGTAQLTVNSPS